MSAADEALWKWSCTSEAKQRIAAAKAQAVAAFRKRFPRANMSRFEEEVEIDPKTRKATAIVLFTESDGSQTDVVRKDQKYWSQPLKEALGVQQDGGFPYQLSLLQQNKPLPVPAIAFSDSITQSVGDLFDKQVKIYVTPTDYFPTKFRQIFTKTQIKFTTAKYARKWLAKPDMSFWPQQLNFALWCATTGCGVSREMLFSNSNSTLNLSEQIRTFYHFHVYYTTRKILFEMGGIQSKNALPDDPAFNQQDNPYDVASYKRICAEFGIDPSTDFRFTYGQNHGLGYVNIMYSDGPYAHKQWQYPPADLSNPSSQRLPGDSGTTANNTIAFIRNDQGADKQFEHFVPNQTSGLTLNGLGRINRSIEAFGYCILGAQANTRSSILGNLGTARNTQTDFLVLLEDALRTLNVSSGPVKYQNAIKATKVRWNFAVARGVLLLPARMIINTESVVGYNNNLRRATDDMKLGVNNHVNQGTKKAGLRLMAGGPSKVNPPNSHPSNPIHKQATEAQGLAPRPTPSPTTPQPPATSPAQPKATAPTEPVDSHHVNKALVAVGALAVVGLIVYASS